jgi:hypothetical protein
MTLRNALSSVIGAVALVGVGSMLGGCGGLGPGDYVIYKVAIEPGSKSSGCYFPADGPDLNTKSDSTNARSSATWILTAGPEDQFFLDIGSASLVGEATDDGYDFSLRDVDVQYDDPNDSTSTKRTTTTSTSISMTIDGDAVSGSATSKTSFKCSGPNCGNQAIPSCTISNDFTGSDITDVELQHEVQ